MTSAINYFSEFWNCLGIDDELGEVVWMAQLSLCAGINIILYLARKVFLFYFSCSSFSIFFHFSNFQKLSSCLILCGAGWYLKYYYRDGVWSHHWLYKSLPFSPHSAWSQGCQYISTFLVFQKGDQICLLASKLLGKSLPWIRKCRNRFIVGCRGKCGVRWYQVPHCSVHGQPRANPECNRAREALKEPFFFFFVIH